MQRLDIKQWEDSPQYSTKFNLVSKYTDLGHPDSKKSLLGVMLNLSVAEESTASSHNTFYLIIRYRTSPVGNWRTLSVHSNVYVLNQSNSQTIEIIEYFQSPIQNILNIQIQIRGLNMRGNFGINDFGIIFREYRSSNVVNFSEE